MLWTDNIEKGDLFFWFCKILLFLEQYYPLKGRIEKRVCFRFVIN